MPKRPDFYTLLGLPRSATQDEIRHAYRKAAKRLHPDTNQAPGETEIFLDVQQAYQVLTDPGRRAAYDATLPPEEKPVEVLEQRILLSRKEVARLDEPQLIYALIELLPAEAQKKASESVPLNLCIVLDCSTSMKGERLELVKAAAIQLIRRLKPQDAFSLVTFNDTADVLIPATRQENLHRLETRVQQLQTGGSTEIFQGLKAGLAEARRYASRNTLSHILLLTDGRTYGDENQCYELAAQAAALGIGISGLGIGSGWNDIFLDHLVSLTGGTALHVAQPKDIERLLNEKFSNLSRTFAESVSLSFSLAENVAINYAFRLQPESAPLGVDSPLQLGPILREGPLSIVLELLIQPIGQGLESLELLNGSLDVSSAVMSMPFPAVPVKLVVPVKENPAPEPPPAVLVQALSRLTLYRLQEKARVNVAEGDIPKAAQHLQRLATQLYARGERNLAKTIMLEVENLEKEKKVSPAGEKQIKYGTRSLLLLPPDERKS